MRHDAGTPMRHHAEAVATSASVGRHGACSSGLGLRDHAGETNFVNVGERTNVTIRHFPQTDQDRRLPDHRALDVYFRSQGGKQRADHRRGYERENITDSKDAVTFSTGGGRSRTCRVPVMIDGSNWEVITGGLKRQGQGVTVAPSP
ncbi:MAG: hypothetical protein HPM95_08715 [Alphaproteobacteria bacterium]|nr:hypothetical protein [Alphaproteobacteria bacterium]